MGWFQAVAGDSITRSYLQFVSIKRDGPECLQRELYAVCGACQLKISLLSEETTNVIPGWGLLAVCSLLEPMLSTPFSSPKAFAFQSQRPRVPTDLLVCLAGNCRVGCSSDRVLVSPISQAVCVKLAKLV